jgi:hypothetical protein
METVQRNQSNDFGQSPSDRSQGLFANAIQYWERRRVIYNLVLVAFVVVWIVATWPHFRLTMNLWSFVRLAVLGLIANACYCTAYFVDIPMQSSSLCVMWRRWRWGLLVVGTLLAIALENYWIADEIYPFVR